MRINTARFDPSLSFVANKPMTLLGVSLSPGTLFPKDQVPERRLRQLYHNRFIVPAAEEAPAPNPTASAAAPSKGKRNG
jgi:hypothetical protein